MDQFRKKYPLRTISDIDTKIAQDDAEGTQGREGEITGEVGYFDIETTSLYPNKGYILCAAIADDRDVVTKWRIDDFGNDEAEMLVSMRDYIEHSFKYVVTWNGRYFDMPWMQHRLQKAHGERAFQPERHIDGMYMVPKSAPSRSLDKVSRQLGLQDENAAKTPYDDVIWRKAQAGDKESMDYIVDHNAADVVLLGRTFRALRGPTRC